MLVALLLAIIRIDAGGNDDVCFAFLEPHYHSRSLETRGLNREMGKCNWYIVNAHACFPSLLILQIYKKLTISQERDRRSDTSTSLSLPFCMFMRLSLCSTIPLRLASLEL